ncbi:hypothetical protein LTR56_003689 [Elasticomyces elasticus]|nr:hypothetical protein LTR22_016916 [Elasticomyces elasticus]KAK3655267.1 hypothetical protein LTR56_003689 [Elasticomyces elasticus]KAK4913546.1 hypothetical protein LTR49_018162 [Elasticomyces elasticus]KAK5738616.1 hypothetical protein LTS12_025535 [Elasticomyces elasticus]
MPPATPPTPKPAERTYYDGDVDFDKLAAEDADFDAICKFSKDKRWLDFQDPKVVHQLTKTLLKSDFNLTITLPPDRLCPPVPVRWNYIHWIQQLLDTTSETYSDSFDPSRQVLGLDIGTGASCIYPLLACSTRPGWRMFGSDIDAHSLDYAKQNIKANAMESRIRLRQSPNPDSPLIPLSALGVEELDFVLTNPPFYSSSRDMLDSYTNKSAPPSAVCTGAENEMICPGGDVGFITRILEESLVLRERVQWYTAMVGKMSSLQLVIAKLKGEGVTNFAVCSLQAGYRTKRWAVGWSFRGLRPRVDVARRGELILGVLPVASAQTVRVGGLSKDALGSKVDVMIRELDVRWMWKGDEGVGVMEAKEDVWSRAARRRKMFRENAGATKEPGVAKETGVAKESEVMKKTEVVMDGDSEEDEEIVGLAVKITCGDGEIDVRWLRGHDYVLFESFCGLMKRFMNARR